MSAIPTPYKLHDSGMNPGLGLEASDMLRYTEMICCGTSKGMCKLEGITAGMWPQSIHSEHAAGILPRPEAADTTFFAVATRRTCSAVKEIISKLVQVAPEFAGSFSAQWFSRLWNSNLLSNFLSGAGTGKSTTSNASPATYGQRYLERYAESLVLTFSVAGHWSQSFELLVLTAWLRVFLSMLSGCSKSQRRRFIDALCETIIHRVNPLWMCQRSPVWCYNHGPSNFVELSRKFD